MSKSKVDLSVFEELAEVGDTNVSYLVYNLAAGDLDFETPDNFEEEYGYEHIEQDGGGEGGGEYCYGIFRLKGKTYKAEYSYYSYHGHDYDSILSTLKEVKPVEKTITVWE